MESSFFEIDKCYYNFNTRMLKKDRKLEKREKVQEEKYKQLAKAQPIKEEHKGSTRPSSKLEKSKSKDTKQAVVTKPRLEALPTINSMLAAPKEERLSLVLRVLPSVMPFIAGYINKKEGSRVVQLLVKWGDETTRQQVFDALKPSWKEMIRGKYSVFVLKQLVRYFSLPEMIEQAATMQGIRQAAEVLEVFIKRTATGTQIEQIKKVFRALSESEDPADQEKLDNLVMKIIEKQYIAPSMSKYVLTLALPKMVKNEQEKVLEYLHFCCLSLIDDVEGLRLFFQLVNYSGPKERKTIVKEFKPHVAEIMRSPNHNSYISLLKLLHGLDDTVLTGKTILAGIEQFYPELYSNRKMSNILYSLFSPIKNNFNVMGKWESTNHHTTGKKQPDARAAQLRSQVIEKTLEAIRAKPLAEAVVDEHVGKLVFSVIRYILIENFTPELFEFVKEVVEVFLADTKKSIIKTKEIYEQSALVCHPEAHRIIKQCIILSQQAPAEAEGYLSTAITKLQDLLLQHIQKTLTTKSSYVLIAVLQNTNSSSHILSIVKKSGVDLQTAVGGNIYLSSK